MDKKEVARYIDEHLLTKQEAMTLTRQKLQAFDQAVARGSLLPYYEHGEYRSKVRLFHRDDVKAYANKVSARRRALEKEIWVVVADDEHADYFSEVEAVDAAKDAASNGKQSITIKYFRDTDGQEAFLNPLGYDFNAINWADD